MDPLDLKKRFFADLLKRLGGESGDDLRTRYGAKPAEITATETIYVDPALKAEMQRNDRRRRMDSQFLEWLGPKHPVRAPHDYMETMKDDPEYKDRLLNQKIERDLLEEEEET